MSFIEIMNRELNERKHELDIDVHEFVCGKVLGIGAVILNGYSYESIMGNLTILCDHPEGTKIWNVLKRYIYIENYKMPELGYELNKNIPSPERAICDFLMYPEELNAEQYIWDILEGYMEDWETPDNWDLVYEMMGKLGISRDILDDYLVKLENM